MDDSLRLSARSARAELQAGTLSGAALLELLTSVPFLDRDAWADELLGIAELPEDLPGLPRESVPYLPCGVEEILAMVREVPLGPDDEFVDLGSGLGRVVILAQLLSGARAAGLELQPSLVEGAKTRCAELGLSAAFTQADASTAELDGSVFFLYAPFNGDMLARTLLRLEQVARRRPIVVCTVGLELPGVPWLRARASSCLSLTLYDRRT